MKQKDRRISRSVVRISMLGTSCKNGITRPALPTRCTQHLSSSALRVSLPTSISIGLLDDFDAQSDNGGIVIAERPLKAHAAWIELSKLLKVGGELPVIISMPVTLSKYDVTLHAANMVVLTTPRPRRRF